MMKKTQILKELNEKDNQSLNKELIELSQKMAKLKLDVAMRKLKNVKSIQDLRHRAARIWTILNDRAIHATDAAQKQAKSEATK